eukprot:6205890-Pleurochrysis_carterae.AAC.1
MQSQARTDALEAAAAGRGGDEDEGSGDFRGVDDDDETEAAARQTPVPFACSSACSTARTAPSTLST